MAPPREVLVTYTLYPPGNGDLRTAVTGVEAQLPLRNLHWKSSTRTSLRTIQEVDVRLVELGDVPPPQERVAGSVLESPLVNVCFVSCDDSDIYKNNTRSFIKDWLSLLSSRKSGPVPLIVLVNSLTSSAAHSSKNVFGRDRGIIAKLKADFNTNKRDICAQLNLPPAGSSDPAVWPDVINKLKDSIVQAFDTVVLEREEEVKRGESQRVTPGWNFCTWFLLKESLAHSFEGVNLNEDALIVYEELEASFLQTLKEQNLSWFGKLGGTDANDDSLPVLDTTVKPYRELLSTSTISIFDFRIYVFARQCIVLGKLGRITEIAKRGQWFVASLARRLREEEGLLPKGFVESWTYTACMDLVTKCDEWSRVDRPNNDYSGLIAYESARAELLDIARVQAERIGLTAGFLPHQYPFQSIEAVVPPTEDTLFTPDDDKPPVNDVKAPAPAQALSNAIFVDALKLQEAFIDMYAQLTRDALAAYEACGKVNSAVRLKTTLAALALHAKDYEGAYTLYRSLARDCAELHVWDPVSRLALSGALAAHTELQRPQDDDWANLAVAYMRSCAVIGKSVGKNEELEMVIAGLRALPHERQVTDNPVFRIRLVDSAASLSDDVSITQLTVEVSNSLPVPVSVDDVWLELESDSVGTISYSAPAVTLQPGKQRLTVACSTSVSSTVALHQAGVALGAINFVTTYTPGEVMVAVNRNVHGLRASLRMPSTIALDKEPTIVLEVFSGQQVVKNARVAVASLVDDIGFGIQRATCEGRDLELSTANIGLGDMDKNAVVAITIPYAGVPRNELAKAQVVVQYESGAGIVCSYIDEQTVFMGLPIMVNVQDFFRPNVLLSSFSIASDGRESVRVKSVNFEASSAAYRIEACRAKWDEPILVVPNQPLSCLFKIVPEGQPTHDALRLSIQYQTVDEEVEHVAQAALDTLPVPHGPFTRAVRAHVANRHRWVQRYLLSNDVKAIFDDKWQASIPAHAAESAAAFLSAVAPPEPKWHTLLIPVEIPLRRLLTTVSLAPTEKGSVYEGRAMAFDLEFASSYAWLGADGPQPKALRAQYDIGSSPDDWIVVGKKRGVYTVDPSSPEKLQLILVPVRAGVVALPSVSVSLVDDDTPQADRLMCETYIANAAQGIRVLPAQTGVTALVPIDPEWDD